MRIIGCRSFTRKWLSRANVYSSLYQNNNATKLTVSFGRANIHQPHVTFAVVPILFCFLFSESAAALAHDRRETHAALSAIFVPPAPDVTNGSHELESLLTEHRQLEEASHAAIVQYMNQKAQLTEEYERIYARQIEERQANSRQQLQYLLGTKGDSHSSIQSDRPASSITSTSTVPPSSTSSLKFLRPSSSSARKTNVPSLSHSNSSLPFVVRDETDSGASSPSLVRSRASSRPASGIPQRSPSPFGTSVTSSSNAPSQRASHRINSAGVADLNHQVGRTRPHTAKVKSIAEKNVERGKSIASPSSSSHQSSPPPVSSSPPRPTTAPQLAYHSGVSELIRSLNASLGTLNAGYEVLPERVFGSIKSVGRTRYSRSLAFRYGRNMSKISRQLIEKAERLEEEFRQKRQHEEEFLLKQAKMMSPKGSPLLIQHEAISRRSTLNTSLDNLQLKKPVPRRRSAIPLSPSSSSASLAQGAALFDRTPGVLSPDPILMDDGEPNPSESSPSIAADRHRNRRRSNKRTIPVLLPTGEAKDAVTSELIPSRIDYDEMMSSAARLEKRLEQVHQSAVTRQRHTDEGWRAERRRRGLSVDSIGLYLQSSSSLEDIAALRQSALDQVAPTRSHHRRTSTGANLTRTSVSPVRSRPQSPLRTRMQSTSPVAHHKRAVSMGFVPTPPLGPTELLHIAPANVEPKPTRKSSNLSISPSSSSSGLINSGVNQQISQPPSGVCRDNSIAQTKSPIPILPLPRDLVAPSSSNFTLDASVRSSPSSGLSSDSELVSDHENESHRPGSGTQPHADTNPPPFATPTSSADGHPAPAASSTTDTKAKTFPDPVTTTSPSSTIAPTSSLDRRPSSAMKSRPSAGLRLSFSVSNNDHSITSVPSALDPFTRRTRANHRHQEDDHSSGLSSSDDESAPNSSPHPSHGARIPSIESPTNSELDNTIPLSPNVTGPDPFTVMMDNMPMPNGNGHRSHSNSRSSLAVPLPVSSSASSHSSHPSRPSPSLDGPSSLDYTLASLRNTLRHLQHSITLLRSERSDLTRELDVVREKQANVEPVAAIHKVETQAKLIGKDREANEMEQYTEADHQLNLLHLRELLYAATKEEMDLQYLESELELDVLDGEQRWLEQSRPLEEWTRQLRTYRLACVRILQLESVKVVGLLNLPALEEARALVKELRAITRILDEMHGESQDPKNSPNPGNGEKRLKSARPSSFVPLCARCHSSLLLSIDAGVATSAAKSVTGKERRAQVQARVAAVSHDATIRPMSALHLAVAHSSHPWANHSNTSSQSNLSTTSSQHARRAHAASKKTEWDMVEELSQIYADMKSTNKSNPHTLTSKTSRSSTPNSSTFGLLPNQRQRQRVIEGRDTNNFLGGSSLRPGNVVDEYQQRQTNKLNDSRTVELNSSSVISPSTSGFGSPQPTKFAHLTSAGLETARRLQSQLLARQRLDRTNMFVQLSTGERICRSCRYALEADGRQGGPSIHQLFAPDVVTMKFFRHRRKEQIEHGARRPSETLSHNPSSASAYTAPSTPIQTFSSSASAASLRQSNHPVTPNRPSTAYVGSSSISSANPLGMSPEIRPDGKKKPMSASIHRSRSNHFVPTTSAQQLQRLKAILAMEYKF